MLADTERRIKGLVDQLDKDEIDARLVSSLGELCEGEWLNRLSGTLIFLKQDFWLDFEKKIGLQICTVGILVNLFLYPASP